MAGFALTFPLIDGREFTSRADRLLYHRATERLQTSSLRSHLTRRVPKVTAAAPSTQRMSKQMRPIRDGVADLNGP
jgi:hypothetical protein